jgi:hypothetical protein
MPLIRRIQGERVRNWNAPPNWDGELNGPCGVLPARLVETAPGMWMWESAWEPTPEELKYLNNGGSIHLFVSAHPHPVVAMSIVDQKEDE